MANPQFRTYQAEIGIWNKQLLAADGLDSVGGFSDEHNKQLPAFQGFD